MGLKKKSIPQVFFHICPNQAIFKFGHAHAGMAHLSTPHLIHLQLVPNLLKIFATPPSVFVELG